MGDRVPGEDTVVVTIHEYLAGLVGLSVFLCIRLYILGACINTNADPQSRHCVCVCFV